MLPVNVGEPFSQCLVVGLRYIVSRANDGAPEKLSFNFTPERPSAKSKTRKHHTARLSNEILGLRQTDGTMSSRLHKETSRNLPGPVVRASEEQGDER